MEPIVIIGLCVLGLACIFVVGYVLFRPVATKDPFAGMTQTPETPADDTATEEEAEETEADEAEAEEETEAEEEAEAEETEKDGE